MSITHKVFSIFAILVLGGIYWLLANAMGGWDILAAVMAFVAVSYFVMGACMAAVIAVIYYLTIYRSNRYVKRLREAGYAVYLDKHEIQQFAVQVLMAGVFTPAAFWLTGRFWESHSCIQAGNCIQPEGWYLMALYISVMVWLLAGISLYGTVSMWFKSFRPLRRYYNDMQLGHTLDLPRLG